MIISAEQLHGLIASINDRKLAVVEAIAVRPVQSVSLNLSPGEHVLAQVVARLPSGQSLATIAGQTFSLPLPTDIKPGDSVRLTYLAAEPLLTFALSQNERQGAATTVSDTARWLSQITRDPAIPASQLPKPAQLLATPPTDPQQIAKQLRQLVANSGLFYESHLAEWATGERQLARVLQEPQGTISLPAAFQKAALLASAGQTGVANLPPPTAPETLPSQASPLLREELPLPAATNAAKSAPGAVQAGAVPGSEPQGQPAEMPVTNQASPATQPAATNAQSPAPVIPQQAAAPASLPEFPGAQNPQRAAVSELAVTAKTPLSPLQQLPVGTATQTVPTPKPPAPMGIPAAQSAPVPQDSEKTTQLPPTTLKTTPQGETPEQQTQAAPRSDAGEARPAAPGHAAPRSASDAPPPDLQGQAKAAFTASSETHVRASEHPKPMILGLTNEPADPRTIPLIREQLEILQTRTFSWQGEGWPGQPLDWRIEEREAPPNEPAQRAWTSTVHLDLPRLGKVQASIQLVGKNVQISVAGTSVSSVDELRSSAQTLRDQFEASGLILTLLEVRHD